MADTSVTRTPVHPSRNEQIWTRRGSLVAISLLAGLAVAVLWSAQLVDDDIGVNAANGILGHDSLTTGITGTAAGIAFAFTAGLAGTFTACNVAAFSAIAPLMDDAPTVASRVKLALRPIGWLSVGVLVVAGCYGAIGATLGKSIPQLSTAKIGAMPERSLQSLVVFGIIGLIFIYLGLAAVGYVPDPLRRVTARFPHAPQVVMGALIGGFLVGRPYPLFYKMFQYAASTHNGFYGALTFILVAIGNIVLLAILFLLLSMSRFQQWLREAPARVTKFTAVALLVGGSFTFFYWAVRQPAQFGYGWFPHMPWH
jgi:sulfite exporter TauE/SafE